ncbi:hypothetical protein V5O48_006858 [Marasmius crinis-equi]|uniref:Uncharacterized protein n=1 Tax=Marasmius crinis-equi TaxID=585013 RepID=A0ABR3FJ40_9AGAR
MSDSEINNNTVNKSVEDAPQASQEGPLQVEQIARMVEDVMARRLDTVLDQAVADKVPGFLNRLLSAMRDRLETNTGAQPASNVTNTTPADNNQTVAAPVANNAQANPPAATGCNATIVNALTCTHCGMPVPLCSGDERWYAVWRARRIGWVKGADIVTDLTLGVRGAGFKFCANEAAARAIYLEKQAMHASAVLPDNTDVSFDLASERGVLFP